MKKFKLSIISLILFIALILISRNTTSVNIFVRVLLYLSIVTFIGAFIWELCTFFRLIPQIGFGKEETTVSKFIKNKRDILGLSVEEVLQKLSNVGLQLSAKRYGQIESGKVDPTGEEFLKIKSILEEKNNDK